MRWEITMRRKLTQAQREALKPLFRAVTGLDLIRGQLEGIPWAAQDRCQAELTDALNHLAQAAQALTAAADQITAGRQNQSFRS